MPQFFPFAWKISYCWRKSQFASLTEVVFITSQYFGFVILSFTCAVNGGHFYCVKAQVVQSMAAHPQGCVLLYEASIWPGFL